MFIMRTYISLYCVSTSYKKCALQFNPERLKNEKILKYFTLICEAYDVLSDSLKRAVFDQYGEEGLKTGVPGPKNYITPYVYHGEPFRTYNEFFGTASPYADLLDYLINPVEFYKLPNRIGVKEKQNPIYHPLYLTLKEIYYGGMKKMKIQRLVFVDEEQNKTEIKEKILTIPIKPGTKFETEIKFPGEGDRNPLKYPADVIFVVKEQPHSYFKRDGDNLIWIYKVSLLEALMGLTITINTLDDRLIKIAITDIICPNYEKIVANEGLPTSGNPVEKGNLILRFDIEFPTYLPRPCKDMISEAFRLAETGDLTYTETLNKIVLLDEMERTQKYD